MDMAISDKKPEPMKSLVVKFPPDLIARLDVYASAVRSRYPGLKISRADIIRRFIERGLAEDPEAKGPL